MQTKHTALILALAWAMPAVAQLAHIPSNTPATGTCFQPGTVITSVSRIPWGFLDPVNLQVNDISFSPCATGTVTFPSYQVAIGHVPNPLPVPFIMPTFSGSGLVSIGDFLDLVVVYDSASQGPFTRSVTANTWSSSGFGTTQFVWNLADDVGIYTSYQNAMGMPAWHYSDATEPVAVFTPTYLAPTGTSTSLGLKTRLDLGVPVPRVNSIGVGCPDSNGRTAVLSASQLPSIGNTAFSLEVAMGLPMTAATLFPSLLGATPPVVLAPGCNAYIDIASLSTLLSLGFGPFSQTTNGTGQASFPLPVPNDPGLFGARIWFQCALSEPALPQGFTVSNALELVLY